MNSLKVLNKLSSSQDLIQLTISLSSIIDNITANLFNITLKKDYTIDFLIIHSANNALKVLLTNNQSLNTSTHKYTKHLINIIEYLLAENIMLQYEIKITKDILGKRKTRENGKRMILKNMQVINKIEFYEKIKIYEKTIKKKKMSIGKP